MEFKPYTIDELLSYYKQNIDELIGFDMSHIYLVNNLQTIADKYHINESCDGMNGFTIPMDGCIVAILNNLDPLNSMIALFHELTHVSDFLWFAKKYNTDDIINHNLFQTIKMYSEINAFRISNMLTITFLSDKNPIVAQCILSSMNLESCLCNVLCRKEIQLYGIVQSLGQILFYDDLCQNDNHMIHIPESVSPRLRGAMKAILDMYFDQNLEGLDNLFDLLAT